MDEKQFVQYRAVKRYVFAIIEKADESQKNWVHTASRACDIFILFLVSMSIASAFLETFPLSRGAKLALSAVECVSVVLFTIEYALHIWTATEKPRYRRRSPRQARIKYLCSFIAIIDLITILPFYISLFSRNAQVLRVVPLFRLLRILKVNRYTPALAKISAVIKSKASELISTMFVVILLMMMASALIYVVESPVQPEVFSNGFSGLWWAIMTFTTVGYGDIVPVTLWGKVFGSILGFLGVVLIAVPTGIISSGFVESIHKEFHPRKKNSLREEIVRLREQLALVEGLLEEEK